MGVLWVVVLSYEFDQNRLSVYRDFRGQNLSSCITLAIGSYSPVLPYRRDCMHSSITLITNKEMHSLLVLSSLETTHSELSVQYRHQTVYADLNSQARM